MRFFFASWLVAASPALADPAEIVDATIRNTGDSWSFSVTLRHADTGWDDYADGWRIMDGDENVLGVRELLHPHVKEQPFTRSLNGVVLPDGLREVRIEASTNTTGWGGETLTVAVPGR